MQELFSRERYSGRVSEETIETLISEMYTFFFFFFPEFQLMASAPDDNFLSSD